MQHLKLNNATKLLIYKDMRCSCIWLMIMAQDQTPLCMLFSFQIETLHMGDSTVEYCMNAFTISTKIM